MDFDGDFPSDSDVDSFNLVGGRPVRNIDETFDGGGGMSFAWLPFKMSDAKTEYRSERKEC